MELVKWTFYKSLLFFANKFVKSQNKQIVTLSAKEYSSSFQWVFCSTIGELNACLNIIKEIDKRGCLVLLTDRQCYTEIYQTKFPNAIVIELTGNFLEPNILIKQLPPENFYICEIPCLPNDAPCRLSYHLLRTVKKSGAKLFCINAWLYEYEPSCRQDALERKLFSTDYVQLFDLILAQTEDVKSKLIANGASQNRVKVTGNMKLDALKEVQLIKGDSKICQVVGYFQSMNSKVFVAGNLSGEFEYKLIIESFAALLKHQSNLKLILAPRHPEKKEQLEKITTLLEIYNLTFESMSRLTGLPQESNDVLLLDTFGQLGASYACADITYVGKNHNILEPLIFKKPVIVLPNWNTMYPSYPIYEIAKKNDVLIHVESAEELAAVVLKIINNTNKLDMLSTLEKLIPSSSITSKNLELLFK
ncbi:3-deoxy-D-manno-octulosonic acid transferase [Colwellia sp. MEBiC06753]